MANKSPRVIYKSAKASPAVKTTSTKMSSDSKRVIAIASVTLFAVLILGAFLFFGQKFVGKAIAFDTTSIGPSKIGIPVSGSAEMNEIVNLPVYAGLGAEKSYAFSVKVQYSPSDFVEFQDVVVPEGIVILDKELGNGYVKLVGASLGDGENPPSALTGKVNLFTLSFKVIDEGTVLLSVPEAEMYNEQGNKITLASVNTEFTTEAKPTVCGDGKKEGTEECDDGNTVADDGCTPTDCKVQCYDSDEGKEGDSLFAKGTVKGNNAKGIFGSQSDECTNAYGGVKLAEYYCVDAKSYDFVVADCSAGAVCQEGKCLFASEVNCGDGIDEDKDGSADCQDTDCINDAACLKCEDSDGGKDFSKKGVVTTSANPEGLSDSCDGLLNVVEGFCYANKYKVEEQNCKTMFGANYFCQDGACIPPNCVDSDGGTNIQVSGTVTTADGSFSDECIDNTMLTEGFCLDGVYAFAKPNCLTLGTGYACQNGVCIKGLPSTENICSDGLDDDGDGKTDCQDEDCAGYTCAEGKTCYQSQCVFTKEKVCDDNIDDDNDGKKDCADTDCAANANCSDGDKDGVLDTSDNCPQVANAGQKDSDGDELGDACDTSPCGNNAVLGSSQCDCLSGWENTDSNWANGCESKPVMVVKGDISGDGCVSMPELMSYIGEWKKNAVTMPDLMTGIGNWKKGGC